MQEPAQLDVNIAMRVRHHLALAAVVLAGGLVACNPQEDQQQAGQVWAVDTVAVRAAIDTLRSAYMEAVASGNYAGMGGMLAEGAVMVPPGGPQWDSMYAESELPFPPGASINIEPIEVRVAGPEWAFEYGNATVTYTPKGTSEPRSMKDTYVIIFRNTGDGWKVYREVASSNLPPNAR